MAEFWVQVKAPAGNWADNMGSSDLESAVSFAKYLFEEHDEKNVRVVQRYDIVREVFSKGE